MRKTISKRLLAIMLSLTMAFSLVQGGIFTASAKDGDVWVTWSTPGEDGTVGQAYTDFITSLGDSSVNAVANSWRSDDGAKNIFTANDIGTLGNLICGCEVPKLDISKDYTIKLTVKLDEDATSQKIKGDHYYINFAPRIAGGSVALPPDWYTLDDIRQRTINSSADDGTIELYRVIPKEYLLGASLEIRLEGPSVGGNSVVNTITDDFAGVKHTLTVSKIELIEGNQVPIGGIDGWNSDGKYYENGEVVKDRIVDAQNGLGKSYIGADGTLVTNAWKDDYYFDDNGVSVKGIQTIAGKTYYFDTNYILYKEVGVIQIDSECYMVSATGEITKYAYDLTPDVSAYFEYKILDNGTAEITKYNGYETKITIPSKLDGYTVSSIGRYAFEESTSLKGITSVTIPDTVKNIGEGAFAYCEKLTSIDVVEGNANYSDIDGILFNKDKTILIQYPVGKTYTSYTTPNTVKSIVDSAFYSCKSLEKITISNSVESIGNNAFSGCTKLKNIIIGKSVKSIGEGAFVYCKKLTSIVIPDSVKSIGNDAFENCTALKTIKIGKSVKTIGASAFFDCKSLEKITIPNSVESIGNNAFSSCIKLKSVTIGTSVKSIGDWAFADCKSLKSIIIGKSVRSIGKEAFRNCKSLKEIKFPASVKSLGKRPFDLCESLKSIVVSKSNAFYSSKNGVLYNKKKTKLIIYPAGKTNKSYVMPASVKSMAIWAVSGCTSLESVKLTKSIKSISDFTFYGCTKLNNITIPNSVTSIDDGAFCDCKSLKSIIIPKAVRNIGDGAFYGCKSLKNIRIPNSVKNLGDSVFSECESLESVTLGKSVKSIGDGAFYECFSLKNIEIPNSVKSIGSEAFYKCRKLKSATLGKSVKSIGFKAFSFCVKLSSITIPANIKSIGNWAFECCSSLKTVKYSGKKNKLIKIISKGNYQLKKAKIIK